VRADQRPATGIRLERVKGECEGEVEGRKERDGRMILRAFVLITVER